MTWRCKEVVQIRENDKIEEGASSSREDCYSYLQIENKFRLPEERIGKGYTREGRELRNAGGTATN